VARDDPASEIPVGPKHFFWGPMLNGRRLRRPSF